MSVRYLLSPRHVIFKFCTSAQDHRIVKEMAQLVSDYAYKRDVINCLLFPRGGDGFKQTRFFMSTSQQLGQKEVASATLVDSQTNLVNLLFPSDDRTPPLSEEDLQKVKTEIRRLEEVAEGLLNTIKDHLAVGAK